jgi:hypothetical protein
MWIRNATVAGKTNQEVHPAQAVSSVRGRDIGVRCQPPTLWLRMCDLCTCMKERNIPRRDGLRGEDECSTRFDTGPHLCALMAARKAANQATLGRRRDRGPGALERNAAHGRHTMGNAPLRALDALVEGLIVSRRDSNAHAAGLRVAQRYGLDDTFQRSCVSGPEIQIFAQEA